MGWTGALPIVAHDAAHTGAGKAPGIRAWQQRARFEGPETTSADLEDWRKKERQWPGTGIACGNLITIDADFATDADLAERVGSLVVEALGETPFVRQGQAPKAAYVYRAAEAMPSVSLKTADGSGDGIDVLAEGRQFVAYGVHRKTLKPYTWIGAESPLTAGPDEAPEVTQAQIDDFLARLRGVVELNGTGGRAGRTGRAGCSAQIVRNADGKVIDGREFHLTRVTFATALTMQAEGVEITVASLASRAWEAFVASTVLDDARWSPEAARVKAVALLDRVKRGFVSLDPKPAAAADTAAPTYPDRRVSVSEAEAATGKIVSAFFGSHVPAWKAEMAEHKVMVEEAKERAQDEPAKPDPVSWAARVETAIGKTALAIKGAADAAKAGISIVYAAPMHSLLSELAERFAAEGVEARVYRGYASPDPDAPDQMMCLDIPAMQDARDAVQPIPSTVCERKDKASGIKVLCQFHDRCGMERQRQAKASVWLVPHALLFQSRPSAIPAPDALVIDEGITMGALPDKPARMSLDAIERAPVDPTEQALVFTNSANDLEVARANLLRALRDHQDDGPLQRAILLSHGLTAATAGEAYSLEWRRLRDPGIAPGMDPKVRKACAAAVGQHNRDVMGLAGIWGELRAFLAGNAEASGRLSLRYDEEDEARILERRSLDTVRSSWSAPALLIDATLPEASLLEPVMGHRVEVKADITAKWSTHVKVRQILGAPVSARKLGIIDSEESEADEAAPGSPKRVVTDLMRLIRLRAALVWPRTVVVIAPMRLIEVLTELGLPETVETAHFGAVAGIDRWANAAGLICIGRLQPGPGITEPLAGIITGTVPSAIPPNPKGGGRWYPRVNGTIRLASGQGAKVEHVRHPDSMVEALRWQITEAGLIQAIGRLRALRRGPEAPAFLDIINEVPLPISVDATPAWDDAKPGAWAEMAAEGVLLESPADIMACFPEAAPTRKAAREMSLPTLALTPIRDINIDVRANVRLASYKRLGRFAPARAILLPNAPADLKSWLSDRLGAMEWVKVEEPEAAKEAEPQPAPAPRWPRCADLAPELAAAYRLVVDVPAPPPAPLVPVIPEIIRWTPPAPRRRPVLRVVALEAAE
jgi:hypothetical protein